MPSPERSDLPPSVTESENLPVVPHLPRRSERAQKVIDFVRQAQQTNQIIPPLGELAVQFGYSIGSRGYIYALLGREGLSTMRTAEKPTEILSPSQELAWMIGILAGGGCNDLQSGWMVVSDKDESFLEAVKSSGERLFETRGHKRVKGVRKDGINKYTSINFYNKVVSRQLGDLKRDRWFQTIVDKHSWILTNNSYIADFMAGIFDTRGLIVRGQILFLTSYPAVANSLSELLTRLGIENPRLRYTGKDKQKLAGIGIYGRKDIKLLADQIHSRKPEKEAKLEVIRQGSLVRRNGLIPEKIDLLIDEYKKAREISLKESGQLPTILDIAKLKQQKVVKYTAHTLAIHFGDGSFVSARQRLEDILSNQAGEHKEAPLPKIRVYARHPRGGNTEIYNPREKLIEEYRRAREICLRNKKRLPQIYDIAELRNHGIVDYTAHTLAIYFGGRSFVKARENLERIVLEKEAS